MSFRCPKCGGTDYYTQKVQTGSRAYDFNPTDSRNVSNDLIPDYMQVPGQVFIDPVMKDVAFCKACPTPIQMQEVKEPRKPAPPGWWSVWFAFVISFLGVPYAVNSRGFVPLGFVPIAISIGLIVKGFAASKNVDGKINGKLVAWSVLTVLVILFWAWQANAMRL